MQADRQRAQLLLIDVQAKLLPAVENHEDVLDEAVRLAAIARRLAIPVTISEHYPKGIGATVPALRAAAGDTAAVIGKLSFSCWREEALRRRLLALRQDGRSQIVIAGLETHVCVCQTALDLLAGDFDVFLAADAVSSRKTQNRDLALARLSRAGATIASVEMIGFEWLERAGTPEFADVFRLLK